jgi:opacity protein-like surface antigen
MRKFLQQVLSGILLSLSVCAYAKAITINNPNWHPVISIGEGIALSPRVNNKPIYFPIQNSISDEYYNYSSGSSSSGSKSFFDIFIGAEYNVFQKCAIQLGLGFNQMIPFTLHGTFVQGADVSSQNDYTYRYHILSRQFLTESKLLYTFREYYHPYIFGGIGIASNQANNYSTNVDSTLALTRDYKNSIFTSFSYNIGVGLDVDLTSSTRFGIAYRFADLGTAQLGSSNIDGTYAAGTLSKNHLYANEILGQFTFLFK